MESIGCAHSIVILTQPCGFVKKPNSLLPVMRRMMEKYPRMISALEKRHEVYNAMTAEIEEKEKAGQILVIRPEEALHIGAASHDPNELERVYQLGRQTGEKRLEEMRRFIEEKRML